MQTNLADPAAVEAHHRRVRYVATYFPLLQGLRFLPLAVVCIATSIWLVVDSRIVAGQPTPWFAVAVNVLLAGALVAIVPIGVWYRRRFGSVTMSRQKKQLALLFTLITALLALLVAPVITPSGPWMVPVTLGLCAVFCAGYYWFTGKIAPHYLWIGGVMLVLGVLHVAGVSPFCAAASALWAPAPANCQLASLFFYAGVLSLVAAVLDHRLLVRTLPRAQEEPG